MYQFNFYSLPGFFTAFFLSALGFFIFFSNRKATANIAFLFLSLSAAVWQFGFAMEYLAKTAELAFFWNRIVYLGVPFITSTMYHFSVSFLELKQQKKFIYLFYFFSIIFASLSWNNYFISGVRKFFWGYYTKVGILHYPFLIIWFIPGGMAIINLFRGYRTAKFPLECQRRKYMFLALVISLIGAVDFLPCIYEIEFYPFGYIPVIICLSLIAYAILKHRLMDITIAITRTGIFIAIYTFVLGLPFILIAFGKHYLMDLWGENWWKVPLALLVILATTGPFLYIYFQKRAENRLLHQQLRYRETLRDAARGMTRVRNLNKLLNLIVHIVTKTVNVSYSGIYLFDINSEKFLLKAGRNLKKEQITSVDKNSHLVIYLKEHRRPLLREEIRRRVREKPDSTLAQLEECLISLNASLIIPAFLEDKLMGFLILGEKRSGKSYSLEDLDTFSLLAYHAGLAIENAMLYENMEEQIKQKTQELVEIQKQLIQAEKLATVGTLAGGVAHEINNPLAAILTSVQMLLMEKGDNIYADRESLEIIEAATKRCRDIVLKLMTYARKPLRHSQPRIEVVNLREVIYSSIGLLSYQLKQENIDIVFFLEAETYTIKADANELQQVFTNMILNARDAIREKKCDKGLISLHLFKRNSTVFVEIKDNGVGMQLEIVKKIFDPFFTTKDVGKGTGLGLSICQSIVESYQGKIEVESKVGEGTTFIISFPEVDTKTLKKEEKERETKIPA